ncbi:hypothetical protein, partial [Rhodovibrio sodomensis]|uniref:hypothetical protein n=1 Tax=Rhodovibrio sodomensis TaxID=1088 RepID=UPI001A915F26
PRGGARMSEDPRKPDADERGGESGGESGGPDSFVDRHLAKIVAAALLVGLLGIAARALVA